LKKRHAYLNQRRNVGAESDAILVRANSIEIWQLLPIGAEISALSAERVHRQQPASEFLLL